MRDTSDMTDEQLREHVRGLRYRACSLIERAGQVTAVDVSLIALLDDPRGWAQVQRNTEELIARIQEWLDRGRSELAAAEAAAAAHYPQDSRPEVSG